MSVTRINIGPVHPSTHGVLRLVVDVDGDTIVNVEPHIGFLHRGVEKLAENRMYMQNPSYMEKLDYVAPLAYDELYVSAVEKALGIKVSERAEYVRVIELELQRIASHLLWLGAMCNDLGQLFSVFMWAMKDRDIILRLLEEATGSRMFYVNMRLGGVLSDLPKDFIAHATEALEYIRGRISFYEKFLESNPIFMERTKGVGKLSGKDAISYGVTGPVLRGSGVDFDVRSSKPYYVYSKLHFAAQVQFGGDSFARYKVRVLEMKESIRLVLEAFRRMPEGNAEGMKIKLITPPVKEREVIVSRELPRGEGLLYLVADNQKPYRFAIRSAPFINLSALNKIAAGSRFADLFAILGSLDMVMADVDK